jgi:hypothetical protein
MRYEQRAVNQIRKAARIKKLQNEPKEQVCVWVVIKAFIVSQDALGIGCVIEYIFK